MKAKQKKQPASSKKPVTKKRGAARPTLTAAAPKGKKSSNASSAQRSTVTPVPKPSTKKPASKAKVDVKAIKDAAVAHQYHKMVAPVVEEVPPVPVEIPLPKLVTPALPCVECGKPLSVADCPVVIEWGKKLPGTPDHIGKPWKTVMCHDCDRALHHRSPRKATESTPVSSTTAKPGKKATANQPGKASAGRLVGRIYRKRKDNPRKEGTHGWKSWELIKDGMSVEEYLSAGGRNNDLRWDIDHEWVEVK